MGGGLGERRRGECGFVDEVGDSEVGDSEVGDGEMVDVRWWM